VTGGAGAPLYAMKLNPYSEVGESIDHYCIVSVRGNQCKVVVYRLDGSVLDEFDVPDRLPDGSR
jgi:hypothetical protein